jgi:Uma2 family endonuclease
MPPRSQVAKKDLPGAEVKVVFTYDDYLEFPPDGKRYEIIDGDVFVTPAPSFDHQHVGGKLYKILDDHVEKNELGEVVISPFDVVLDMTNVVQPDVVFIAKKHLKRIERDLKGPPDLAVEVLSPSTARHDRTLKLRAYERHGVPFLWFLDPKRRELEEHVLTKGRFRLAVKLEGGATFEPRVFPGLEIPLARVWPKKR